MNFLFYLSFCSLTFCEILAKPFLYETPLTFLTQASAAASSFSDPSPYISDYRAKKSKVQDEKKLDEEDFFKEAEPPSNDADFPSDNDATPTFLQKKFNKIIRKINFFTSLSSGGDQGSNENDTNDTNHNSNGINNNSKDDDFDKVWNAFDKEYAEDFNITTPKNESKEEFKGYNYRRPVEKLQQATSRISFNPAEIGVFFMEMIGTLVGLVAGATAQFTNPNGTPPV